MAASESIRIGHTHSHTSQVPVVAVIIIALHPMIGSHTAARSRVCVSLCVSVSGPANHTKTFIVRDQPRFILSAYYPRNLFAARGEEE